MQQGVRFDPDMPQTIRLEFAKSNTKGKTNCNQKKSVRKNKRQEKKLKLKTQKITVTKNSKNNGQRIL